MSLKLLKALEEDCREDGALDVADGIAGIVSDIEELCAAIKAERDAVASGDTIATLEARLRTTQTLVRYAPASAA